MKSNGSPALKGIYLVVALILTGLGGVGVFGNDLGFTDALFEPDYTIRHAPADGPLAEAGFFPGDSVISVEGIPVAELGMYSRWPRSLSRRPGESITMMVEREGERVTGEVVYRRRPASSQAMQMGGLLVFLTFLWVGAGALFTLPASPGSTRLATMGMAAGLAVPFPNAGSWNGLVEHLHMAAMSLWTIQFLWFFLLFPKPKKAAEARVTKLVIYLPWVILLGCLVVELLFHPRFYHSFGGYGGIIMFAYLIAALAAFLHGWMKTPGDEMGPSGMRWILVGMALAVGGNLFWLVDALLLPNLDIPGSGWATTLIAAVPLGMFMGLRRASG